MMHEEADSPMPPAVLDAPPQTRPPAERRDESTRQRPGPEEPRLTTADDYRFPPTGRVATRVVLHTQAGPVRVPGMTASWDAFRPWVLSDERPEKLTFNFLGDTFEAGAVNESRDSHATPKTEITYALRGWAKPGRRALVFCDAFRLADEAVGLSCEPDAILVSAETEAAGRVSWTRKKDGSDFVEVVGAADLVCEILSGDNPTKDLVTEPPLLFAAGVREFWRVDCRDGRCELELLTRGPRRLGAGGARRGRLRRQPRPRLLRPARPPAAGRERLDRLRPETPRLTRPAAPPLCRIP